MLVFNVCHLLFDEHIYANVICDVCWFSSYVNIFLAKLLIIISIYYNQDFVRYDQFYFYIYVPRPSNIFKTVQNVLTTSRYYQVRYLFEFNVCLLFFLNYAIFKLNRYTYNHTNKKIINIKLSILKQHMLGAF